MYGSCSENSSALEREAEFFKTSLAIVWGEDDDSDSLNILDKMKKRADALLGKTTIAEAEMKKRPSGVINGGVDSGYKKKTKKSADHGPCTGFRRISASAVALKTLAENLKFKPQALDNKGLIDALLIQDILVVTSMDEVQVVISLKEKSGWLGSVVVKAGGEQELMSMKKALAKKGIHIL